MVKFTLLYKRYLGEQTAIANEVVQRIVVALNREILLRITGLGLGAIRVTVKNACRQELKYIRVYAMRKKLRKAYRQIRD